MYHLDANETPEEKAKQELHKNTMYSFEQILEAAPPQNSICTVTYLPSHKLSLVRWTRQAWYCCFHMDTLVLAPAKSYIHQLRADTVCSLVDLARVIDNRDGCRVSESRNSLLSAWFNNVDDDDVVPK